MAGPDKGTGDIRWMYASLPANLATGPMATLITLYILQLGGGVLDVAYAITLSSAVTIPAVFFWGYFTDLLNKRKLFVVLSYLLTSLLVISLFFEKDVAGVTFIYALMAFAAAAAVAPLNLLVMETGTENRWAHNFSVLQMLAGAGTTIGLVVAWIVTGVSTISYLLLVLFISSIVSALMAIKMIKEPKNVGMQVSLYEGSRSFMYRLVGIPNMIIRIPNLQHITNLFRFHGFRSVERRFVILFYVISFVFFLGTGIFNTEFPVGLKLGNMSESLIFFIILISTVVQTAVFHYYDSFARGHNTRVVSGLSLIGRGSGYLLVGLFFILFRGLAFYIGIPIFYVLAAGVAYAVYYTTSYSMLFRTLSGKGKGSTMGIYSAVIGVGSLSGALLSGGLVVEYGFGVTFIMAAALMFLCSYMFRILPRVHQ